MPIADPQAPRRPAQALVPMSEHCSVDEASHAHFLASTRLVMAEHGHAAFEMPKRTVCLHEAGHCVVYAALGIKVISASVRRVPRYLDDAMTQALGRKSRNWCGETTTDVAPYVISRFTPQDELIRHGMMYLAGVTAEWWLDHDGFRDGSSLDEVHAAVAIAGLIDAPDALDDIIERVDAVLLDNEVAVLRIAMALFRDHRLSGARLARLLADVRAAH